MKKLLVITLSLAVVLAALSISAFAAFEKTRTYEGQFADVSETAWYAPSVKTCYEIGLINGASATSFNPQGMFTLAEAATIAARMHNIYNGGDGKIPAGEGAWYNGAVNYCIENGIFKKGEFADYTRYATRAEMAGIVVAALPKTEWKAINNVTVLPDVENNGGKNETAVFTLYNAGILAGSDEYGKFQPNAAITRAEVAALVVRMADADKRLSVNLKPLSERKGVVLSGTFSSVTPDGKIIFSNNGKYGVMTVDGSVVVPNEYTRIEYLENCRFVLYSDNATKIADTNGKVLYTYEGGRIESLGDDYYLVNASYKNTGKLYKGSTLLVNGLSSAERNGDFFAISTYTYYNGDYQYPIYGAADKNGKILVEYDEGNVVITDNYFVRIANYTYTFYDKSGKLLCSGDYADVSYESGLIVYRENGKYGLATVYGKVVDALYDSISLSGEFAILRYGTMCALAGTNGIIFDLGEYLEFGFCYGDYAIGKRDGALDIVDVTGDVLVSVEGNFEIYASRDKNLIRFGYVQHKNTGFIRLEYNFAYDTVSKQVLKGVKGLISGYNYATYYANEEKCFLADGTEVAEVTFIDNSCIYKSLDGKYGGYYTNVPSAAVYDTLEAAAKGDSAKLFYTLAEENGKPVVKYGDDVVIQYYKAPFYYDNITELGYNNYYICTFNNVNYIIHP